MKIAYIIGNIFTIALAVAAIYHMVQSSRIMDRQGKQTFMEWIRGVDVPRGKGY